MPNVTMPNGDVVAFPDDMPKADISAWIEKTFPGTFQDSLMTGARKGLQNVIPGMEQSLAGISQGLGEFVTDAANREAAPPAMTGNLGLDLINAPANAARTAIGLLPEQTRKDLAYQGAVQSLRGQLRAKAAEENMVPVNAPPLSGGSIAATVTQSTAQMLPAIAASVLMRNPTPALAAAGIQSGGQAYRTGRQDQIDWSKNFLDEAGKAGLTPEQARQYAGFYAAAEAIPEMIPLGILLKEGGSLIARVIKTSAAEGVTEGITQTIQSALDKGFVTPDMTWEQAWPQIVQAMAAGTISGAIFGGTAHGIQALRGKEEESAPEPAPPVPAPPVDTPIEDQQALPAPQTLLALPSPEQFKEPVIARRQPQLQQENVQPSVAQIQEERDYQARVALQKTRQAETSALLQTARETITPLGTFTPEEIGDDAAGRVRERRVRLGRPVEAPVTVDELAAAKVPQKQIDAVIAARRPQTAGQVFTPLDIVRSANSKNIIVDDSNFSELAYRTTGQRNVQRMTQAQLGALKSVIDAMPAHESPVTVPVADSPSFTEEHYNKALDAIRKEGRYTAKAIKDATGFKSNNDVAAIREAMVRRGQLVQRGKNDFRLYDVVGQERQTTPADLPPGAFSEYVTREIPVRKVRIRQDGQSVGTFSSATEARSRVRDIRSAEDQAGQKASSIAIEPAGDVAWGVMENRYDEAGNLLGQAVVSTHKTAEEAQAEAGRMGAPDTGARYTQTTVEPVVKPIPLREVVPAALEGRLPEIVKRLNQQAKDRRLPLLGVRVQLKSKIIGPESEGVAGLYLRKLIQLSAQNLTADMSTDEIVEGLAGVMDHETIHALREAGVLAPETDGWKAIVRYARRAKRGESKESYTEWAKRVYTGVPGYETTDAIEEEAIAEAFRAWAANRRNVVGQPATVFRQIVEWFKRLISALPEDVFQAIESGSLVEAILRPPGSNQPRAKAATTMQEASRGISEAQAAQDENLVRVRSREYLRARAQAREDRYGRSGPKTVLGTTPSKAYETGEIADRALVEPIVARFRERNGIEGTRLQTLLPVNVDYLKRVADAQQAATHDPGNDAVAKAYRALINETKVMWQALGDVQVVPWTSDGQPYASPSAMMADIAAGRLNMRLSDDMFGPGANNPGHPLNAASGFKATDGRDLSNNDLFRVVHDVYGHGQSGFRDDARGAYNAYHEHARLVSKQALPALATETLAQRAWQDYGAHLRRKDGTVPRETDVDYLPPAKKEFAQQKAFLLDPKLLEADPGWTAAVRAEGIEGVTPKFNKFDDDLPGGRLYGNPKRSPGGALSKPDTPTPAFTSDRPGNRWFGGELAEHQLQMARTGEGGTTMVYLPPESFLALANQEPNPEQEVYDLAVSQGYKLSGMPSLITDGYAGNVRVVGSDGTAGVRALASVAEPIPVVLYPKKPEGLGLVTALEANGTRIPWPHEGRAENFPERRLVNLPAFKRWFGDSKVVDAEGKPLVVYHGTSAPDFEAFDAASNGHFFTSDPRYGYIANSERVVPVYLKIENPYYVKRSEEMEGLNTWHDAKEWLDGIKVRGHDGVVWGDPNDLTRPPRGAWGNDYPQLYVFSPTQIKSVYNVGTFDPNDERIRYSLTSPYGTRLPTTPPGPMFNIVQQRIDGAVGRFIKNIGRSKRSIGPLPSIYDLRVKLQDKMLSWKELIEYAAEHGGMIDDVNNVYMLEQLYHGKVFDQIVEREERLQVPLLAALKAAYDGPKKITPKDFEDYLYARHAPERNTYLRTRGAPDPNPSGMSDTEAQTILDTFALDGKLPDLEALAALADRITADTTSTRVEYGLISPAAADASPYQYYVPLRGFADEDLDPGNPEEQATRARSGRGFSVGGREDRSVTGRGRKAGDLLGHLFLQNTEAVIRGHKNEVALAAMRLIQDNASMEFGSILATAPTRRVVGANGMIHEAGDPTYRQQPDIITAKWKGKEVVARLADPRLARAIKSDYVTSSNALVNTLGLMNRYLAMVNTSMNPEFLISNLARDMQTAGLLAAQYDIKGFGRKIIGNAPKAMAGIREVLRNGTANGPWAALFKELQTAGGTTEFLGIHDLETQINRIRRTITQTGWRTTPRKAMGYLGEVFKFVNDYNKVAENAFRLSAYKAARDAGVSIPQAAYLAKNLTVNFNKGGEQKALMNSLYLFYNAGLQGSVVLVNGLKNKRVRRLVAAVTVAGILQDVLNRALSGDDDDNGVTDYDDIPDYVLEHNFVLMDPLGLLEAVGIKQGYFALPMPYGFNAFYNLGRNMSAAISGSPVQSPGKAAANAALGFLDAFNPLGGAQSFWNFLSPTFLDPAVDIWTNKDFSGKKIVPDRFDQPGGVPVPDSQKYWSTTGDIPKDTATWLNAVTGGNEVRKGAIDWSPETLQYAFDFATGSMSKFGERVGRMGLGIPDVLRGDFSNVDIGEIPFARRVVGSIGNRGNTERYYDTAREVFTVRNEIKMYAESGKPEEARRIIASKPLEARFIPMFESADKTLQDMREQLRNLRDNPNIPADRRHEMEKKIKDAMDRLMAQVNRTYFEKKKLAVQ